MNIDRKKLKMGIWYEDKNGKMIKKQMLIAVIYRKVLLHTIHASL